MTSYPPMPPQGPYPPPGPYPPEGYPGQPSYPGQPYPGQPSYPGQPYPGQPYPGQPYPGQPYPGQPYPGGWGVPPPPSNKKPWLIVGGVSATVAALLVGLVLVVGRGPISRISDEAQIRTVIAKIGRSGVKPDSDLYCAKFNSLLERYSRFGRLPGNVGPESDADGRITSIKVHGDRATVTVLGRVGNRSTSASITFVKEGGKWKMCPDMPNIPDMP